MLERVEHIRGIGLLHDANGSRHTFRKVTLIYSDNGRGKSTLSSVLRSVATGNGSLISARKTIDGTQAASVTLQFESGHKVNFANGVWSEPHPELLVFDSDFIEKNVHSGATVSTEQRKNLLEFALGEQAVAARTEVDRFTVESQMRAEELRIISTQLSSYHAGITLERFKLLPLDADADAQIATLQQRIAVANSIASIALIPVPIPSQEPVFELEPIFTLLRTALDDIHENVGKIVHAHIKTLGDPDVQKWLSEGSKFDDCVKCPYCGQGTKENELILAYRKYFNDAYVELKNKVEQIHDQVFLNLAPALIKSFDQGITTANTVLTAWQNQINVDKADFDDALATSLLQELQTLLFDLATRKQAHLADFVGSDLEKIAAEGLWKQITDLMQSANQAILTACAAINTFRTSAATEDVPHLQAKIQALEMAKTRHTSNVVDLIARCTIAQTKQHTAESSKQRARVNLDIIMKATLTQYESSINDLLRKFGASFTIEKMDANYRGTAPRSEYGLQMRGKSIPLDGGSPSFATALSEGDKRTLAFAFFVASALSDPKIAERLVVIDDPMCSLDKNRRQYTKTILKQISEKAEQIIVLAHDIYFIRDLRDDLTPGDGQVSVSLLQLKLSTGNYSDFHDLDIDKECESPYHQHHRMLVEFTKNGNGDHASVAKAIRPMLEGYLHRRFPILLPNHLMFGEILTRIENAVTPSPFIFAQPIVEELRQINEYVWKFHHDTPLGDDRRTEINSSELMTFSNRALDVVYGKLP